VESVAPYPFELEWTVKIGPLVEHGKGLLTRHLFAQLDLIDQFTVRLGAWSLIVEPKAGQIRLDSAIAMKTDGPARLVWFRRMEKQIATRDPNAEAPRCLWYGVGLERGGKRIGFRLFEDGRHEHREI
jgi:hypothetical protein